MVISHLYLPLHFVALTDKPSARHVIKNTDFVY